MNKTELSYPFHNHTSNHLSLFLFLFQDKRGFLLVTTTNVEQISFQGCFKVIKESLGKTDEKKMITSFGCIFYFILFKYLGSMDGVLYCIAYFYLSSQNR